MQINKERLVQTFCEMVSIDSESYHEKKMKDYLMNIFKRVSYGMHRNAYRRL